MRNKILVLNVYDKNGISGVKEVVNGIKKLRELKGRRFLIYTMCLRNIEGYFKEDTEYDYFINSFFKLNFGSFLKFKKIVKNNNIRIIHSHQGKSLFYSVLYKKFFDKGIFIIQHEHGEIFYNSFFYKKLLKLFMNQIDMILPVSKSVKKDLAQKVGFPERKMEVLYNFVDLETFKNTNQFRSKREDFVIGFVGRLSKVKGCEYLIKALPYLNLKYKCVIVGDGDLRMELEHLSNTLGLSHSVEFLGFKKDIHKIYPIFDILVMPSLSEASPMTFYEAQAFGIPVLGSDVVALNEFIIPKENGLLFELKNHMDLADKINFIFAEKMLYKKMSKNSKANVEKYSYENYLGKLSKIYEKIYKSKLR